MEKIIVETRTVAQIKGHFMLIKSQMNTFVTKGTFDPFLGPKAQSDTKSPFFIRLDFFLLPPKIEASERLEPTDFFWPYREKNTISLGIYR